MSIIFPENFSFPVSEPASEQLPNYREEATGIISRVAYLIGVPKRIFDNPHEPPDLEVYKLLDLDKNARIVRNLCCLRTSIEQNY